MSFADHEFDSPMSRQEEISQKRFETALNRFLTGQTLPGDLALLVHRLTASPELRDFYKTAKIKAGRENLRLPGEDADGRWSHAAKLKPMAPLKVSPIERKPAPVNPHLEKRASSKSSPLAKKSLTGIPKAPDGSKLKGPDGSKLRPKNVFQQETRERSSRGTRKRRKERRPVEKLDKVLRERERVRRLGSGSRSSINKNLVFPVSLVFGVVGVGFGVGLWIWDSQQGEPVLPISSSVVHIDPSLSDASQWFVLSKPDEAEAHVGDVELPWEVDSIFAQPVSSLIQVNPEEEEAQSPQTFEDLRTPWIQIVEFDDFIEIPPAP